MRIWIWEAEVRRLEAGIRAEAVGVWNEEGICGWLELRG